VGRGQAKLLEVAPPTDSAARVLLEGEAGHAPSELVPLDDYRRQSFHLADLRGNGSTKLASTRAQRLEFVQAAKLGGGGVHQLACFRRNTCLRNVRRSLSACRGLSAGRVAKAWCRSADSRSSIVP
jgi:hypothetical protein